MRSESGGAGVSGGKGRELEGSGRRTDAEATGELEWEFHFGVVVPLLGGQMHENRD